MVMSGFISVIPATNYSITETEMPVGFSLTAVSCKIDPLGINESTGTADVPNKKITGVEVRVGLETVCIFNDEPNGTIKIIKDTEPDDTTLFDFTRSFGADFALQDDGNEAVNPSTIEFTGLLPGSFSVTELINPDYVQSLSCVEDKAQDTTTPPGLTALIELNPDETVTCTFLNEIKEGTVIIIKDTEPDRKSVV